MVQIIDYGTYIIDLADAMIDHRRGLSERQLARLNVIRDKSVRFVTSCIQHENSSLDVLYEFLDVEAKQTISLISSYSDFLLMEQALAPAYKEAIGRIKGSSKSIEEELTNMKEDLERFMGRIGMQIPKKAPTPPPPSRKIKRLQPKQGLQVDYLDGITGELSLEKPQKKALKKLKPKPRHSVRASHVRPTTSTLRLQY